MYAVQQVLCLCCVAGGVLVLSQDIKETEKFLDVIFVIVVGLVVSLEMSLYIQRGQIILLQFQHVLSFLKERLGILVWYKLFQPPYQLVELALSVGVLFYIQDGVVEPLFFCFFARLFSHRNRLSFTLRYHLMKVY